jgi:hypothetical protein
MKDCALNVSPFAIEKHACGEHDRQYQHVEDQLRYKRTTHGHKERRHEKPVPAFRICKQERLLVQRLIEALLDHPVSYNIPEKG